MSAKNKTGYTVRFAVAVCLVCSVFVCVSAVALRGRQEENKKLDMQVNVLKAAGLVKPSEDIDKLEIGKRYSSIRPVVVDMKTGLIAKDVKPADVNMRKDISDTSKSFAPSVNDAKVLRVPNYGIVYELIENDKPSMLILPVSGKGLWSTLYGFLALDYDTVTIKGVSFYEHGETPGLGGEISNSGWTDLWKGRKIFDEQFNPVFKVKKGAAGSVADDPYEVDGLSGATLTGKGVTHLVQFWTGKEGYGLFLENFRKGEI
ncbi:MAG: Na(+)-translocating NADH-quinone reductase subunit C [Deltaproteobacteria bacterium]|nr:Na(+)-translocating NADH-quinone reductase subunit C [Deltaproteobacteria bacterium]